MAGGEGPGGLAVVPPAETEEAAHEEAEFSPGGCGLGSLLQRMGIGRISTSSANREGPRSSLGSPAASPSLQKGSGFAGAGQQI